MDAENRGRVLVAAFEYHPLSVGAEARSSYQIVRGVRALGRRVVVVIPRIPNSDGWYGVIRTARRPMAYGGFVSVSHYLEWLLGARRIAKRIGRHFRVCQQVSPMTFRFPSPLAGLGLPFIWGPVGGSIPYPPGFEAYGNELNPVNLLRRLDRPRLRFDPSMRHTVSRADRIVVTTSQAAEVVPDAFRDRVVRIPDGMPPEVVWETAAPEQPYVFSSGRLIPYKAMDLLIRAFAIARSEIAPEITLKITGDGPERPRLEAMVERLGLRDRVNLLGNVPRDMNRSLMRNSLMCVYPSLREGFGHVNLEAMGAWKPVIVTDWGGPRDIVVDEVSGIKVLGRNPEEHAEMLAAAMVRLAGDAQARARLGRAAAERVATAYSWPSLARQYDDLYRELGA